MRDRFKEEIENGFPNFQTPDAMSVIRDAHYVNEFLDKHLERMNEEIALYDNDFIDSALERAKMSGRYDAYMEANRAHGDELLTEEEYNDRKNR